MRRGQTPEQMQEMIHATQGIMAVLGIVITSLLSILGIYLGRIILCKYLERT